MARRKTLPESVRAKYALAERLSQLRGELFGDRGGPELARQLGLPVRTWYNYESGVTVPAEVILKIIELTSAEPMWLLHGRGPKFRPEARLPGEPGTGGSISVPTLLRTALQLLEQGEGSPPTLIVSKGRPDSSPTDETADVVLIAVDDSLEGGPITKSSGPKYVAARREWLDAERECRVMRVEGTSMSPIVADGAYVAFAKQEEDPARLDGKMVIAWVDHQPIVRWFSHAGRYAVLRAENPATSPSQHLIDLEDKSKPARFRRVLWINTPH
ncbi:MAG: S24 family peptidase [Isosphaeraceae bacterium]